MGFPISAARFASRRALTRGATALSIACICALLLVSKLDGFDKSALLPALSAITWWQWTGSIVFTALSFAALGQYDTLFHRWLGTGIATRRGFFSGMSAIAISQTAGFGLVTGTLARWRALPELSMTNAFKLTNYVSFSFMAGLGVLTTMTVSIATLGEDPAAWSGLIAVLGVAIIAVTLSLRPPEWLPFAIPPIGLMWHQTLLTAIDVAFAAAALFVFLPDPTMLSPTVLFTVFVLSLGAGLVSGVPGGVGPFELCLVSLLPTVPVEDLVVATLAFRLVYYILPAGLGALWILTSSTEQNQDEPPDPARTVLGSAETQALVRLPGHQIIHYDNAALHICPATQSLISLGDPATDGPFTDTHIRQFYREASARCLFPAFYKTGAKTAARLRRNGWAVLLISEEASLDLAQYTTTGATGRQLRRKLKQAEAAGIKIVKGGPLPISEMSEVSAAWVERQGGERGFSMGTFDPTRLHEKKCMLAYRENRLIAFATFHHTADEWSLDLMRSGNDASNGTMHALINAAAIEARQTGAERLSLAAMPLEAPGRILRLMQDMNGLRQFKLAFRPRCRPLYLAAPSPFHLALAGADILLRIQSPPKERASNDVAALHKTQSCLSETSVVSLALAAHISNNRNTRH